MIKVGNFEYTEVWDNVYYKKLSKYPCITDWEIRNIIEFIDYEKMHGRECTIECEDKGLLDTIYKDISNKDKYIKTPCPQLITECTACPYRKGCVTEFVCHTTSIENAIKIFESGKLLSALNARKIPVEQLINEKRNAANDPTDYFEYIMFAWGNCQAGDRLVMERKLGRFPDEKDLSTNFTPGVRFYFKYDELKKHPNITYDGVLPMKVKDEIILSDWVHVIIIPTQLQKDVENIIPSNLKDKVIYVENDCEDIWDWSEKVYKIVEQTKVTRSFRLKKLSRVIMLCLLIFISCIEMCVILYYINNFVNGFIPTDFVGTPTGDTVYGLQAIKQDLSAYFIFIPVVNVASLFQILYFGITMKKDKGMKKIWLTVSIILLILNILLWVWIFN